MRLFADSNIAAQTVRDLRGAGHDVVYSGERAADPGDLALLSEARNDRRLFVTKDHDLGALVFRDGAEHAGILLIDDLADPDAETAVIMRDLASHSGALESGAFVRAGAESSKIVTEI